jgi:hypothetical protein
VFRNWDAGTAVAAHRALQLNGGLAAPDAPRSNHLPTVALTGHSNCGSHQRLRSSVTKCFASSSGKCAARAPQRGWRPDGRVVPLGAGDELWLSRNTSGTIPSVGMPPPQSTLLPALNSPTTTSRNKSSSCRIELASVVVAGRRGASRGVRPARTPFGEGTLGCGAKRPGPRDWHRTIVPAVSSTFESPRVLRSNVRPPERTSFSHAMRPSLHSRTRVAL